METDLDQPMPTRVSVFVVCQGGCYCGAGIVWMLWPAWLCKLLLAVGLGGVGALSDSFELSRAEAGMTRLVALLLIGVGWLCINGGLSGRIHFLGTTFMSRVVFVPFGTAIVATIGARVHLCVLFGVLEPVLAMLTYLVLLGCKDACLLCFKLLLPALLTIAVALSCAVAATVAATAYSTSISDWLTVQMCAVVFAVAAVSSLCLSSLDCVSAEQGGTGGPSQVDEAESSDDGDDEGDDDGGDDSGSEQLFETNSAENISPGAYRTGPSPGSSSSASPGVYGTGPSLGSFSSASPATYGTRPSPGSFSSASSEVNNTRPLHSSQQEASKAFAGGSVQDAEAVAPMTPMHENSTTVAQDQNTQDAEYAI